MAMAYQYTHYMPFSEILERRARWTLVQYEAPRETRETILPWLAPYPGEYDVTTEPTLADNVFIYRWWFSDPDTAFAFKIRWV
jgi:hypothetical protein